MTNRSIPIKICVVLGLHLAGLIGCSSITIPFPSGEKRPIANEFIEGTCASQCSNVSPPSQGDCYNSCRK